MESFINGKNKRKNISDPVEKKLRYKSLGNVILLQDICTHFETRICRNT